MWWSPEKGMRAGGGGVLRCSRVRRRLRNGFIGWGISTTGGGTGAAASVGGAAGGDYLSGRAWVPGSASGRPLAGTPGPLIAVQPQHHAVASLPADEPPRPQQSLALEPQSLEQSKGGCVPRIHVGLDPIEGQRAEGVPQDGGHRLRGQAPAVTGAGQGKPDLGPLIGKRDVAQGDGADDP